MTSFELSEFNSNSFSIVVSREYLLSMGLEEPTPDERAEMDERSRRHMVERNKQACIRESALVYLGRITDVAARAVLELHSMVDHFYGDPTCAHCADSYMGDHELWPCDTVRAIGTAYGIEMPT